MSKKQKNKDMKTLDELALEATEVKTKTEDEIVSENEKQINEDLKYENDSVKKQNQELIKQLKKQSDLLRSQEELISAVVKNENSEKYTFDERHPKDERFPTEKLRFKYNDGYGDKVIEMNNDKQSVKAWARKHPNGRFIPFK